MMNNTKKRKQMEASQQMIENISLNQKMIG